ncbi:hypothetical protein ACK323_06740 [Aeromonas enteropelogenes]|uniref:hypothetical protein n=1 Tax=Aeromonas enteropelogenes TaxID=29489 RepID=UPI003988EA21
MRIMSRPNFKIESLVSIVTVLAIPLFLVGQYFDMGYYNRFGISTDLFERSVYQVLSNTILVVVYFFNDVRNNGDTNWSLFFKFIYIGVSYLMISFACWHAFYLSPVGLAPEKNNNLKKWTYNTKTKVAKDKKEEKDRFAIGILLFFVKVFAVFVFVFFSIIIPTSTYTYGQYVAEQEIEKNKGFVCNADSDIYQVLSFDGKLVSSGIYIMSSPNALAIWRDGIVEVFPMSQFRFRVVKCDISQSK